MFLRGGYRGNYDTDWLTAGAGFAFANMRLDYAYAPFTILGDTHRMTLSVFLGGWPAKPDTVMVPLRLTVNKTDRTSISLQWEPNGNPSGTRYEISQSRDAFANNSVVVISPDDDLTATSVVISGLMPDTDYWFRVRAVGKKVGSPSSNITNGHTLPDLESPATP